MPEAVLHDSAAYALRNCNPTLAADLDGTLLVGSKKTWCLLNCSSMKICQE